MSKGLKTMFKNKMVILFSNAGLHLVRMTNLIDWIYVLCNMNDI